MRLGSDPEVFLIDEKGLHISAIGFINADKWHPMQVPNMQEGFTLQEDNVALEYGVPPAATAQEFAANIKAVMEKSREYFPNTLNFSKVSCTVFDKSQLQDPRSHVFGCEPDFNAWTMKTNPSPRPGNKFLRSAGGHVHIETQADKVAVVRAFDLFAVVPSILMDDGELRREMYGKAGAFRPKSYGVECRSLSNFWIFEDRLCEWVWKSTETALNNLGVADEFEELILDAINNNNKDSAKQLCSYFNMELV